jgi:hypothetical protein
LEELEEQEHHRPPEKIRFRLSKSETYSGNIAQA